MHSFDRIRRLLFDFYFAMQRRIVPGLRDSQYLYIDTVRSRVNAQSRWLDLGCGHQIFPAWTKTDEGTLTRTARFTAGVDCDCASIRHHKSIRQLAAGDIGALPFRDGAFNLISANMVVEHLWEPIRNLQEVARVLQPGGVFIFHTINRHHYHARIASCLPRWLRLKLVTFLENRREEDVYPTFYRMNTRDAIEKDAAAGGFTVRQVQMVNSSAATVMLGPVVILELLIIRLLTHSGLADWRRNIIAVLEKSPAAAENPLVEQASSCAGL
jgi:SAM-dependent methyltransferase